MSGHELGDTAAKLMNLPDSHIKTAREALMKTITPCLKGHHVTDIIRVAEMMLASCVVAFPQELRQVIFEESVTRIKTYLVSAGDGERIRKESVQPVIFTPMHVK